MYKSNLDRVLVPLAAFTLTSTVLINFLAARGWSFLSSTISYVSLYLTTFIAALVVFFERKHIPSLVFVVALLFGLQRFGVHINTYDSAGEYATSFLIHGIGGFLIGLSIRDVRHFIKLVALFSILYTVVLIREPINRELLKLDEMVTGYQLTALTINIILAYFTVFKKNKLILVLALISTLLITLFTSRGCGVALLLTWGVFYVWDRRRRDLSSSVSIVWLSAIIIVGIVVFRIAIEYVFRSQISIETGSLLEKIANGYVNSSNGREDLWQQGIAIIGNNWKVGLGFGADRILTDGMFIHNIILELLIDFGIPITIIILILYWVCIIKGVRSNVYSYASALIMAQVLKTWVQLLFSSSYLYSMLGLMLIIGLSLRASLDKRDLISSFNTQKMS